MKQILALIPLDKLIPSEVNPRTTLREIEELAASITANLKTGGPGILQPLAVRKAHKRGYFVIRAGHRREAAARIAGMTEVPCIIEGDVKTADLDAATHLVENVQRDNLTPWELARGVGNMIEQKMKQKVIAAYLGKSEAWVSKLATIWKAAQKSVRTLEGSDPNNPYTYYGDGDLGPAFADFTNVDVLYEAALFMLNPKPDNQGQIDLSGGTASTPPAGDPAEPGESTNAGDAGTETGGSAPADYTKDIEQLQAAVAVHLALPVDSVDVSIDGAGKVQIAAVFSSLKSAKKALIGNQAKTH